jgi:predicted membrane metal-binding protein
MLLLCVLRNWLAACIWSLSSIVSVMFFWSFSVQFQLITSSSCKKKKLITPSFSHTFCIKFLLSQLFFAIAPFACQQFYTAILLIILTTLFSFFFSFISVIVTLCLCNCTFVLVQLNFFAFAIAHKRCATKLVETFKIQVDIGPS